VSAKTAMLERSTLRPIVFGRRTAVPEPKAQPSKAAAKSSSWQKSVVFCVLGFLAGAPFWHLIGFWGYLTGTVPSLQTAERPRAVQEAGNTPRASASPARATQPGRKATVAAVMNNCTALVLDRSTGATLTAACKALAPVLAEGTVKARGDLLAQAWPQASDVADAGRDPSSSPWHITVVDVPAASKRAN
jgi:hypothetical protein